MAEYDISKIVTPSGDICNLKDNISPRTNSFITTIATNQWIEGTNEYYITINSNKITENSILIPSFDHNSEALLTAPVWCEPANGSFSIHTNTLPLDTVTILVQIPGIIGDITYQILANNVITGVKGDAETDYRTGNVNLTAANIGAININDIANNLTTDTTGKVLSATQGKVLNDKIGSTDISSIGASITAAISSLNSNKLSIGAPTATFGSIEFSIASNAGHGGFIDFHYNGSTSDFTSRIVESASNTIEINGVAKFTNNNVTITGNFLDTQPPLNIIDTSTGTRQWNYGLKVMRAGMNSGENIVLSFGKEYSIGNCGILSFHYDGNQSSDNYISAELWGINNLLRIYKDGRVNILGDLSVGNAQVTRANLGVVSNSGDTITGSFADSNALLKLVDNRQTLTTYNYCLSALAPNLSSGQKIWMPMGKVYSSSGDTGGLRFDYNNSSNDPSNNALVLAFWGRDVLKAKYNGDIELYKPLAVAQGGTGATTAAQAKTNLGIGTVKNDLSIRSNFGGSDQVLGIQFTVDNTTNTTFNDKRCIFIVANNGITLWSNTDNKEIWSSYWRNVTNNSSWCTWNSNLTFVNKFVLHRYGELYINATISSTNFTNGITIVTLGKNANARCAVVGTVDGGNNIPDANNIGTAVIGNGTKAILGYKTTPSSGYFTFSMNIPIAE